MSLRRLQDRKLDALLSGGNVMTLPRRNFLRSAASVAALPALSRVALAQNYPSRPVTMIVTFPAGGAADVIARVMAERMRQPLGQPVIIENIGGADGSIGVGRAARARPDGYTICLGIDATFRSEEHTSELQSRENLVCR